MPPEADESGPTGTITSLLRDARSGIDGALDELFGVVYNDLRHLARRQLGDLGVRDSIEGTALVNSACERLLGRGELEAEDRRHFYYLLSRAMHDVLVEHIRAQQALRRGGGMHRVPLVEIESEGRTMRIDLLAVHEALQELRRTDPEAAQVVELRFFANRTLDETGELMGTSFAVTRRHWEYAKAWLHERLSRGTESGASMS